jgi:hypothetical protein
MMPDEVIGDHDLAALIHQIQGVEKSIRWQLRPIWSEVPPAVFSMVCAGLADLMRDPYGVQLAIDRQGDPQHYEHYVSDLQGIEVLFASELQRLRALVVRYGVPELTAALLADPDTRRAAQAWLAHTRRR